MAESRWRKIEVRIWGDEKFRTLSPLPPSGQSLWLFLLTGPHTSPIPGLFKAGRAALAEELGWSQEDFDKAFDEVRSLGMARADWKARVVWIPNAIKCNMPQSPNVVTSWRSEWLLIPECGLKSDAYCVLKSEIYELGETFRKAFDKALSKPSSKTVAIQEQEQEQEQGGKPKPPSSNGSSSTRGCPVVQSDGIPIHGLARGLMEKLKVPTSHNVIDVVAQAIRFCAETLKVSHEGATDALYAAAYRASRHGQTIGRFWFEDTEYEAYLESPIGADCGVAPPRCEPDPNCKKCAGTGEWEHQGHPGMMIECHCVRGQFAQGRVPDSVPQTCTTGSAVNQ